MKKLFLDTGQQKAQVCDAWDKENTIFHSSFLPATTIQTSAQRSGAQFLKLEPNFLKSIFVSF